MKGNRIEALEKDLNQWFKDRNLPITFSIERLEKVYQILEYHDGHLYRTTLQNIEKFDSEWEDNVEKWINDAIYHDIRKSLNFRRDQQW